VHALRPTIPAGCTIVEYAGEGAGARFARVGAHVVDGMPRNPWTIVELPIDEHELRALSSCAYYYEGLPCFGQRPPGAALAPPCAAMHELATLHEVDRLELVSRPYDENLGRSLADGETAVLRLFRIRD
jgi:hypothetical protein